MSETAAVKIDRFSPGMDVKVRPGETFFHVLVQEKSKKTQESRLTVNVGKGGAYRLFCFLTESLVSDVEISLKGEGASADCKAVYILGGTTKTSLSISMKHLSSGTRSAQKIRGAAFGSSIFSFDGLIYIGQGLSAVQSKQEHKAILASPLAEIKTKPSLEIYSDDVECAHGAAIGQLDERQIFYLKTRGIDETSARRLLIEAFLKDLLDSVSDEKASDVLREKLSAALKEHEYDV